MADTRSRFLASGGQQNRKVSNLLFAKKPPPEVSGVGFGDAERVTLELAPREESLDFCQHVTKDEGQLGQVPPGSRKVERDGRKERDRERGGGRKR